MKINREPKTYLTTEDVDALGRQNTQLITELWILKDRLAVLENLLAQKGLLSAGEVDAAHPDEALSLELDRERERYLKRIVGLAPAERSIESLKALGSK
ncbi:MAG: hypothetical protein ACI87W_002317 [Halieaceae bacterium]|jgi:hypothetical protein